MNPVNSVAYGYWVSGAIEHSIWWGLCYIINVYYREQFSYKGSTENEYKKVIGWSFGIGGTVASVVLLKKALPKEVAYVAVKAVTEPEKTFGGVPLSKLNEIAKAIDPRNWVSNGCSITNF